MVAPALPIANVPTGDPAGHLNGRKQRVQPLKRGALDGNPKHGKQRMGGDDTGQMSRSPCGGD